MKEMLEKELLGVGAKTMHLKKIWRALDEVIAPHSAKKAMLKEAQQLDAEIQEVALQPSVKSARAWRGASSKKFAAFLSHHKGGCAMEARFIKGELEKLLETEIFLDSDLSISCSCCWCLKCPRLPVPPLSFCSS